jgi:hypothetical protein
MNGFNFMISPFVKCTMTRRRMDRGCRTPRFAKSAPRTIGTDDVTGHHAQTCGC